MKVPSLADSRAEGFDTSKKVFEHRHQIITLSYYILDKIIGLPSFVRWFMLLEDEKLSYSLFRRNNSLFWRKHFPVLICREFVGKTLKLIC